jgi:hypothetical protein
MLFLASMGETGLNHDIFFEFSLGPLEVVEAEGGRLVKEANFEAEKKNYYKKKFSFPTLLSMLWYFSL